MLVSLNWLRDYVAIDLAPADLARRLVEAGLPVEGIEAKGDDFVLNVEVTSNRPDCLGHIGVAREIAALTGAPLRLPDNAIAPTGPAATTLATVRVESVDLCPQYTARVLTGVKVGPAPAWMVQRLEAVGLRSVSNVVDITNYVLMECGQPLHAFDLDKLRGKSIVVRRAKAGETMTAINGKAIAFDPKALGVPAGELPLVIADADRPVAVAGVMGGAETEVGPATHNLLLESAEFEMLAVRRGSRKLLLDSDSSYRFERGIDPAGVEWGSRRAAKLLTEHSGAQLATGAIVTGTPVGESPEITLRESRIKGVLGINVSAVDAGNILARLGFRVLPGGVDALRAVTPSWRRRDVTREIDLIEEVARIRGYAGIPEDQPMPVSVAARSPRTVFEGRVCTALHAAGCYEVITKTLVDKRLIDLAAGSEQAVTIDPDKTAFHYLRRSLLPALMDARRINQNVGVESASIFEIAKGFRPKAGAELPDEPTLLTIVCDGESEEDWRRFRGVVASAAAACGLGEQLSWAAAAQPIFDPQVSVELLLEGKPLGGAGRVSRDIQKRFDLRHSVMAAELDFDLLCAQGRAGERFRGLPRFPAIVRDMNVVIDQSVLWERLEGLVRGLKIAELESLAYLSTYSKGLAAGKKSVTFSMTFRSASGTLTADQAGAFHARVLECLKKELGAELRA